MYCKGTGNDIDYFLVFVHNASGLCQRENENEENERITTRLKNNFKTDEQNLKRKAEIAPKKNQLATPRRIGD